MDVTPRKRTKIITLQQYGNNMTQRKIAEVVGVSLGVVNKLIRQRDWKYQCPAEREVRTKEKNNGSRWQIPFKRIYA